MSCLGQSQYSALENTMSGGMGDRDGCHFKMAVDGCFKVPDSRPTGGNLAKNCRGGVGEGEEGRSIPGWLWAMFSEN